MSKLNTKAQLILKGENDEEQIKIVPLANRMFAILTYYYHSDSVGYNLVMSEGVRQYLKTTDLEFDEHILNKFLNYSTTNVNEKDNFTIDD